jgi:hypothetical protein
MEQSCPSTAAGCADDALNIHEVDPVEWVLDLTDDIGANCVIEAVGHYQLPEGQMTPLAQAVKMIRMAGVS